ncbi:MAG: isopentenyl phosphate kinase [Patescibacteria group bacterium]|nr:isopentenyl phosphate kinase [Patescibacteria group bacterium]
MKEIVLIKLGGSLITDKEKPFVAKKGVIDNLACQIAEALKENPEINLIIGNGGGSFPHYPAVRYEMSLGIRNEKQKYGFCLVQDAASQLNRIVVSSLLKYQVKAFSIHPSSIILSKKGQIRKIFLESLLGLLKLKITPVVYGDIVYDEVCGSTIFSTERLLVELAKKLKDKGFIIKRIIHNGITKGVLNDKNQTIPLINKENFSQIKDFIFKTQGFDVTGGMLHKIKESLNLAKKMAIRTIIINGVSQKNLLKEAILGKKVRGTVIEG